jgi:hypothetical protein
MAGVTHREQGNAQGNASRQRKYVGPMVMR